MDDQYIGKRCPACGLYLAECVLCTPAEVEAATRRKLAGPPVPATLSLEAIRRVASDDSWILARMALPLVAEVERLTSERDTERAMRIERDGLLAAERERFAVAYDAAQKLARERDDARADFRDLSEAVKAAWHQCNSAGLNREQYAALHRAFEISVARQVG